MRFILGRKSPNFGCVCGTKLFFELSGRKILECTPYCCDPLLLYQSMLSNTLITISPLVFPFCLLIVVSSGGQSRHYRWQCCHSSSVVAWHTHHHLPSCFPPLVLTVVSSGGQSCCYQQRCRHLSLSSRSHCYRQRCCHLSSSTCSCQSPLISAPSQSCHFPALQLLLAAHCPHSQRFNNHAYLWVLPSLLPVVTPLCGVILNLAEQYVAQPCDPPPLGQRDNTQSSLVPPLSGSEPMLMPMLVLLLTPSRQQPPLPLPQSRASTALVVCQMLPHGSSHLDWNYVELLWVRVKYRVFISFGEISLRNATKAIKSKIL